MSLFIIFCLLAALVFLSLPTLRQIAVTLRDLSTLAERAAGDIVKTIDLPGSSSTR